MKIKAQEVCAVTNGKLLAGNKDQEITGVTIDSRQVALGDIFVALPGENTDGHLFVESALQQGAAGAIVKEKKTYNHGKVVIQVEDTLKALQILAKYNRDKLKIPLVGVTGSVGKTTTKDLIAAVLQEKYPVLKTAGNFNNQLGLPLTLLRLNSSHQAAVVEMGMRGLGEIKELTELARPNIGVITNIGRAHLELLGSREKIAQGKSELVLGLPADGVAVLNGDDEYCLQIGAQFTGKKIIYGFQAHCDVRGTAVKHDDFTSSFRVKYAKGDFFVQLPLPGEYNILNALAAIAVGLELGLEAEQIKAGLAKAELTQMRLERLIGKGGEIIINDAYNANPDSMIASLKILHNIQGKRKMAVLGDMYELGEFSESGHRQVGAAITGLKLDLLVTVGKQSSLIGIEAIAGGLSKKKVKHFASKKEAAQYLEKELTAGDVVLVKGSRGMAMEEVINSLIFGH